MYIKPPENYNFTIDPSYILLVENSGCEDKNLLHFIKECHYHIDYCTRVYNFDNRTSFDFPIMGDDFKTVNQTYQIIIKKFRSIDDLISFVGNESESNYFILFRFSDLTISYCSIPFDKHVVGLHDDMIDDIREFKLNKIFKNDR